VIMKLPNQTFHPTPKTARLILAQKEGENATI